MSLLIDGSYQLCFTLILTWLLKSVSTVICPTQNQATLYLKSVLKDWNTYSSLHSRVHRNPKLYSLDPSLLICLGLRLFRHQLGNPVSWRWGPIVPKLHHSIFRLVQPSFLGFPVGVSLHDLPSLPHRSECPTLNPNTPGWGLVLASVFPVSASCLLTEDASLPRELRGRFGLWMSHLS